MLFHTIAELSHHYQTSVFVPAGVPVGPPQAGESAPGVLKGYGYDVFDAIGGIGVLGPAPASPGAYERAVVIASDEIFVRRAVVRAGGGPAILVEYRSRGGFRGGRAAADEFRLFWAHDGKLLEADVTTADTLVGGDGRGGLVTPGPDTLVALADAMVTYTPGNVDAAPIVTIAHPYANLAAGSEWTYVTTQAAAAAAYGGPVSTPPSFASIAVLHAGVIRSYTVDLDPLGQRRLFLWPGPLPAPAEATAPGVTTYQSTAVNGSAAVYERVQTATGTVSSLFFSAGGRQFLLRDMGGGSQGDLESIAGSMAGAGQPTATPVPTGGPSPIAVPTAAPTP